MEQSAKWIKAKQDYGQMSPEFRKTYRLNGAVRRATATVSALGVYNFYVNGAKVGDALLAPYWTSYPNRVQEQQYDITNLLTQETTFGILVGKGWALGRIRQCKDEFCGSPAVICDICIEYTDGQVEHIVSDESWQVWSSQILASDFYDGETVDRTAEVKLLDTALLDKVGIPQFARKDRAHASGAEGLDHDDSEDCHPPIVPQVGVFVREHERIVPCEVIRTPKGEVVLDFGQNLAGYVEVKIRGKRGDRIVMHHAEVLDRDGNFYTDNMRSAKNENVYILSGEGEEVFKPSFCFQGFRYIRLSEFPQDVEIKAENFTAIAIYSDMKRTGDFSCGNEKINRLYSNAIWGQRGNFIDVPTDCPQRDERMGWVGDAQVFCRTAAINYDVEQFFEKWLGDMALEQGADGSVNAVIPTTWRCWISAGWADACVICPWELYQAYGNKKILQRNFDMMKKWIGYMRAFGDEEYLFVGGKHYGDWLALDAGDGQYKGATQTDLIASAYFAYSTSLVIKTGKILGEDMSEYETLYTNVRKAFRKAFMKDGLPCIYPKGDAFPKADMFTKERTVKGLTQTAIVLILRFGLCEENERQGLIDKLAELIAENDGRMTTGFLGTPNILHALSENGRIDLAYDLLFQEKSPSWLFSVNQGATTTWEHWDSLKEDGTFWSADMNSFNHYAYGSVFDWIYGVALGITVDDDGAGYKKITVAPVPDRRMGFAKGTIETRQGKVESYWSYLPDGRVRYEITVPQGTQATVKLPGKEPLSVSGQSYVAIV